MIIIENFHGVFQSDMYNLKLLDMKFNKIKVLRKFAMRSSILSLYLAYNQIFNVDKFAFKGFNSLKVVDLSYNMITNLPAEGIGNINNFVCFILSSNPLTHVKVKAIQKINAHLVIADNLWACCILSKTNLITLCGIKDFSIHCKRLLQNNLFLSFTWINGFSVIITNGILLCGHKSKFSKKQFSFKQLDLNLLGLSNLVFGVYLLVIAAF